MKWASDVGGLMGIWFGASIVSFVEFFEFLFDLLIIAVRRRNGNDVSHGDKKNKRNEFMADSCQNCEKKQGFLTS